MDEYGTATDEWDATCGSCDYDERGGWYIPCHEPAPYRAEYRWLGDGDDPDYTVAVCIRHAATARTRDSLKRIYSA